MILIRASPPKYIFTPVSLGSEEESRYLVLYPPLQVFVDVIAVGAVGIPAR